MKSNIHQSINQSYTYPNQWRNQIFTNQSINQSIIHSSNQWIIDRQANQSINQSYTSPISDEIEYPPINQSINRSYTYPISEWAIDKPINQSIETTGRRVKPSFSMNGTWITFGWNEGMKWISTDFLLLTWGQSFPVNRARISAIATTFGRSSGTPLPLSAESP